MQPTDKRYCKLERGELRRVPQDRRSLIVGYHVCCPQCGFVTVALNGHAGLVITESEDGERVSLSDPIRSAPLPLLRRADRAIGRGGRDRARAA